LSAEGVAFVSEKLSRSGIRNADAMKLADSQSGLIPESIEALPSFFAPT
jgi:hypothetical protein